MKFIILTFMVGLSNMGYGQMTFKEKWQANAGFNLTNKGLPIYGGFDYGIHNNVTVGAVCGINSYSSSNSTMNTTNKATVISIGGNINYHANTLLGLDNKWDVYGGGTLGYWTWFWNQVAPGQDVSSMGIYTQLGARYFFNENFGINLELGSGYISGAKLGLTYRM